MANSTSRGEVAKDKDETKEQLIAESACNNASEYTLTLPIEYQGRKHRGAKRGE